MRWLLGASVVLCLLVLGTRCDADYADMDSLGRLYTDLDKMSDPMTPPLLQGQTEKDFQINMSIGGTEPLPLLIANILLGGISAKPSVTSDTSGMLFICRIENVRSGIG